MSGWLIVAKAPFGEPPFAGNVDMGVPKDLNPEDGR